MKIILNHNHYEIDEATPITALVQQLALTPTGIAIAVNQTIVPPSEWQCHMLNEQDIVDIFNVVAGG